MIDLQRMEWDRTARLFKASLLIVLVASAAGCVTSYEERQARLHEVLLYWQPAATTYVDYNGEKVKVDRLPAENGRTEMRVRHLCSECQMPNPERLEIVEAVALDVMADSCAGSFNVLDEGHTVEPMGLKRNYSALSSGIRRYEFSCGS